MPRSKKTDAKPVPEPEPVEVEEEEIRDEDIEDAETLCTEDEEDIAEEEFFEVFLGVMTDKDGNNVVDAMNAVKETIEKQNKILYKIMQLLEASISLKK